MKLNYLQWLGQWRSSTTFYMPAILSWKLIRNHLKLYCPRVWIKLLQDYSGYWLRTLAYFAYHFTVRYIPGITNQFVECLSCLGGQKDSFKLSKLQVHQITSHLNVRSDSLQEIRVAMQEDDQLALLKYTITHGWPNTIREVPSKIQPSGPSGRSLQLKMGLSWKGHILSFSSKKCQSILYLIHEGHLGLAKCKLRAKDTVYWPGLNEDLEKLILNCELCLKYSHSKCKQKPSSSLGQEIPVHLGPSLPLTFSILKVHHICY